MDDRIKSEAELIETFLAPLAAEFPGALGLLDDCARLTPPPGCDLVMTADAVAAGVHFFPDDAPEDIAWKALAVNVSDLAGKAAEPICYLMSLACPEAPERQWLERFAAGLGAAQDAFSIRLAGGDSDRRPGPLSITITAVGSVPAGRMIRRATARPGDRLFVTGTLGDAALGLRLRTDPEYGRQWRLDARGQQELLQRYLRPNPRLGLREALRGAASAAMDLSDGLAKDLGRLCKASGIGAEVTMDSLPLSKPATQACAANAGLLADVVTGGDDYEILAAVPGSRAEFFVSAAARGGLGVTEIGVVTEERRVRFADSTGHTIQLDRPGWDHF